jgi:DNA-binding response OmpR family regulator
MLELKRILIIEDDEDHAFLEKDILEESLNVEVDLIASGLELDHIHLPLFQIILLDFNLPDTTGTIVLDKIRQASDIPVILVTGRDDLSIAIETLKKGANDFLIKTPDTIKMLPTFCQKVFNEYITKKTLETKQKESEIIRARIETLSQTLTTLSHYINNSTTTISGYAQLCQQNPKQIERTQKLVEVSIKETKKITIVLKELQQLVNSMDLRTTEYVNIPNAMFALEERLNKNSEES